MKKNILITLCVALMTVLVGLTSCKDKKAAEVAKYDAQIEQKVASYSFPQKLNDNSSLTSMTYQNKILTYKVEVNKDRLAEMKVEEKRAKTLDNLQKQLLPNNLVTVLLKANASVQYVYYNEQDSVSFIFTPEDLKLSK